MSDAVPRLGIEQTEWAFTNMEREIRLMIGYHRNADPYLLAWPVTCGLIQVDFMNDMANALHETTFAAYGL